jgi:glycosyltransferase involved in cell wall biosynthesis
MGLSGGVWTAIRTSELVALRHSAVRMLFSEVDHVVAVCEWVKVLLTSNGVDARKITLSRQGLSRPVESAAAERQGVRPPLRIAFLGRIDAVKGLGVLIEALQRAPKLPVVLDIFAVVQGQAGERLKLQLSEQVKCDPRISFRAPLAAAQVVDRLREYDALAVPSQWMETGPLVVYEAFAAGIPVIGSRLGGIAELVRDEENGLLVEASSPDAWAAALGRLVDDPNLLPKLKSGIKPVRTMLDVAKEMRPVYESVLAKKKTLVGSTQEGWTQ